MDLVEIFSDGACSGNPGPGGWGAVMKYKGKEKEISGSAPETTNNRMELTAVIESLSLLKRPCKVKIYTDSKYVLQGATEWLNGWKSKGWKKADKREVVNRDLWEKLDTLLQTHTIEWEWVKGHAGHPENERADTLATSAIQQTEGEI